MGILAAGVTAETGKLTLSGAVLEITAGAGGIDLLGSLTIENQTRPVSYTHLKLTRCVTHSFLCQQSRAIRTTDGKDRADLYAVAVCGLECRHNAGIVIHTALQYDVLPHRFRTNNFMQIVLYDGVTKACGNIRL